MSCCVGLLPAVLSSIAKIAVSDLFSFRSFLFPVSSLVLSLMLVFPALRLRFEFIPLSKCPAFGSYILLTLHSRTMT